MKHFLKLASVWLLLAPWLASQQNNISREGGDWVQAINGSLAAARTLHVKLDGGSVRVEGDSQPRITYEMRNRTSGSSEEAARHQFEGYKINAYVSGDTAWIVGEWQGSHAHHFSSDVAVHVPRNIEQVTIETDGGEVTASGISGSVDAESGGGPIRIHEVGGSVHAETGGDNIEVGAIGGDVKLDTGGGRVVIESVKGKLNATTGGGDIMLVSTGQDTALEAGGGNIHVKQCGGKLKISTGGGNVDVGDAAGGVEIETGGGSITVNSAKGPVHAETGSGRIVLEGVPSAHAETGAGSIEARFISSADRNSSTLETAAGDVVVYLPQNLNASIRASIELANGHGIHSDFPDIRVAGEGGRWGTLNAEGALNGGGPTIKVTTVTGDIWFRRAN